MAAVRVAVGDTVFVCRDQHRIEPVFNQGTVVAIRKKYFDVEMCSDRRFTSTRTFDLESGREKGEFTTGQVWTKQAFLERGPRKSLRNTLEREGLILRAKAADPYTGLSLDQLQRIAAILAE